LHRFEDMTAPYVLLTPRLFHLNIGVFPLHQIVHVGVSERISLKLFGREIIFEVFHNSNELMSKTYLNVTDRRTDGQTICSLITSLCIASRGKNL